MEKKKIVEGENELGGHGGRGEKRNERLGVGKPWILSKLRAENRLSR